VSRLLTVAEAAVKLNVSERWIRSAVFEQRFAVVKLGRLVRIDERDLDAYIERNRVSQDKSRAARPALSSLSSPVPKPRSRSRSS
jgi:excisionase family DNA binding protein